MVLGVINRIFCCPFKSTKKWLCDEVVTKCILEQILLLAVGVLAVVALALLPAYSAEFLPMFDKTIYSIGQSPVITVQDSSKNLSTNLIESVYVKMLSESYPAGVQLKLVETGLDTGIFTGKIRLSSNPGQEGTLYVQEGDSIHSQYITYIKTAKVLSGSGTTPILVSTDKLNYKSGEIIKISGSVSAGDSLYDVNLSIVGPHGSIVYTESVDLSYMLRYSTEINTADAGWGDSGNYKVVVWHQSENILDEAVFSFSSTYGSQETGSSIKIFGSPVKLDYSITSGRVSLVKANVAANQLVLSIDVDRGGHLTVELPRYIMDAKENGADSEFVVLMDYRTTQFVEKKNPNERTLTIPYIRNTKTILIEGTHLELNPQAPELSVVIPNWVRSNAEWWSKSLIGEDDFVSGIQYLITQGVIQIPAVSAQVSEGSGVPPWVKNTAGWWSKGMVSDAEFVDAIQYLMSRGIISV